MNAQVTENKHLKPFLILLLVVLLLGGIIFALFNIMRSNTAGVATHEPESPAFLAETSSYSQQINKGNQSQALATARKLLASSETPLERGRANLMVGLAERSLDPVAATERFKEVSRTEAYHPFTRAIAMWHVLEPYFDNRDSDFARDHIYTGDMWSEFVDDSYAENSELMYRTAAIEVLRTSLDLEITVQVAMRLATEMAGLLQYDHLSDEYKNELANNVQEYIDFADQELVSVRSFSRPEYSGAEFITITTVLNSKALALDTLFIANYISDIDRVVAAYREAMNAVVSYNIRTNDRFFVRYNYADFLARTNLEDKESLIVGALLPMSELDLDSTFAQYVLNRFASEQALRQQKDYTGHPQTMRYLADISPEFRSALLRIGVQPSDVAIE